MPRKDVEFIKKHEISTDKVIEVLQNYLDQESSEEVEEEPEEEIETEESEPEGEPASEPESEPEQISMEELDKRIDERVKKILKIKRKVPSKGTIVNKEDFDKKPESIKKNWFEVLV